MRPETNSGKKEKNIYGSKNLKYKFFKKNMDPKIEKMMPLKDLKDLRARIDKKLKQMKEMKKLKEIAAETRTRLIQGIRELENSRKAVSRSIEKLTKTLKRK